MTLFLLFFGKHRKVLILNFSSVTQIHMKKETANGNHQCSDCRVNLVKNGTELICPNCGLVEQFFDGAE